MAKDLLMAPETGQTLDYANLLTDQDVCPIVDSDAVENGSLLCEAAAALPEGRQPPYFVEERADTIEAIPLAPWLQDMLPSLREIEALPPNWDSYGSPPPSGQLIGQVLLLLHRTESLTVPHPNAIPASGGGIQLEWRVGPRELEVEFSGKGMVEFLATDRANGVDVEGKFAARDYDAMRSLLSWINNGT